LSMLDPQLFCKISKADWQKWWFPMVGLFIKVAVIN
jgi:hypothetical protein